LEFHPTLNVVYVVNELSSTIAVFEVDRALLDEIAAASKSGEDMSRFRGRSSLRLVQSISTLPSAFPTTANTCGRICVHQSGRFVVVSNRGHQSIAVYKVRSSGPKRGELQTVGYFHTRGETPRHFQFDNSGQYLLVANQDTDSLAVFSFNLSSGTLKYTGNEYGVPSPNFVCSCPTYEDDASAPSQMVPKSVKTNSMVRSGSIGSDCTSEESTKRTTKDKVVVGSSNEERSLKAALADAQKEIAELKQLLPLQAIKV
jgi:6-phosphogluconolactonase